MNLRKSGCFLIADEVGLGKTKSAKAVLYEMMRLKDSPVHCIYMASSLSLARQNMEKEFLAQQNGDSYDGLRKFQVENAEKALQMLFASDYQKPNDKTIAPILSPLEAEERDLKAFRISMFEPKMCSASKHYIMRLSPKTSFRDVECSDYRGTAAERTQLYKNISRLLALIDEVNREENIGDNEPLMKELWFATLHEG